MRRIGVLVVWAWALASLGVVAGGCGSSGGGASDTDAGTADTHPPGDCDPMVPTECGLPFPSSFYLRDDPTTPTGHRVHFGATTLPKAHGMAHEAPDVFNQSDGFSPGASPFTHLPGATATGLPDPNHIADSVQPGCPTVLLAAATGELVPHFAEIDATGADDSRRALMIRPAVRLDDDTRYIVAIRGVVDGDGNVIPASEVFRELRDGLPATDPTVTSRRDLYADIFEKLAGVGVDKGDLQIAWDFTTASRDNNTKQMLAMRDDALMQVGSDGPSYTIDDVTDSPTEHPHLARVIRGTMTVPLYLDQPSNGATLQVDAHGMPVQSGTADYPFTVIIPNSVANAGVPVPVVQYGHGLLGSQDEVLHVAQFADDKGFVMFATDWIGMAMDDVTGISSVAVSGDFARFSHTPDRLRQGFVNALLAMRMVTGKLATDPAVMFHGASVIDPTARYYYGNSQGGIMGTVYMSLSTDVTRGVLGVPGEPFSLLLNRSHDFVQFFALLRVAVPDPLDDQLDLGVVQMLWDRAEPDGYSPYVTSHMLPGTPGHRVLIHIALADHQVTPLGGHVLARTVGAVNIGPVNRTVFGIPEMDLTGTAQYAGSAMVEFDYGQPAPPLTNIPPTVGDDTHEGPRYEPAAQSQMDVFLRTGEVQNFCDGPCDPE